MADFAPLHITFARVLKGRYFKYTDLKKSATRRLEKYAGDQ